MHLSDLDSSQSKSIQKQPQNEEYNPFDVPVVM